MQIKQKGSEQFNTALKGNVLIDTHCHLDMPAYAADLEAILERAFSRHIKRIITIGIDLASSKNGVAISRKHKQVSATIGFHPHDVDTLTQAEYRELEKIYSLYSKHIVGFGEIGLDYFKMHTDAATQRHHFRRQLDMAHELNLPVIIHNREADNDILRILREASPLQQHGIMHCFSGDYEFAKKILDLGMLISIPGIVTFKNSALLQEVVKKIPLTSMVMETDGPFLAPQPYRGKRNEPSYLINTAVKIAEIRQIEVALVAAQTTENAERLFAFTTE